MTSNPSTSALSSAPGNDINQGDRAPSTAERVWDRTFRTLTWSLAWFSGLVVVVIILGVGQNSWLALSQKAGEILTSTEWAPNKNIYGLLPHIGGTLYTSLIAVFLGTIFGVSIAIFISENFLPRTVRMFLKNVVELLAAIPSVIYGLWGIGVLKPFLLGTEENPGPLFGTGFNGYGILPASLVLTLMILPTISSLSYDALTSVPKRLREGAYGLGATRWEVILQVSIPTASGGIIGSVILALGRALGETMALAMLIGNTNVLSWNLLSTGNTLAAVIANNFPEASSALFESVLMSAALVLMIITLVVNAIGSFIISRTTANLKGLGR